MNPFDLSASDLLIWGIVLHLIADWPLQNDWMAQNKMRRAEYWFYGDGLTHPPGRRITKTHWWYRHPAAHVHAAIHMFCLSVVFGYVAVPLALAHLIIDTRWPVVKWAELIGHTPPQNHTVEVGPSSQFAVRVLLYDMGTEVRIWTDQVFHIVCIAVAALLVCL